MDRFKKAFMSSFNDNNKDKCVELTIDCLEKQTVTIPILYEEILRPALYSIDEHSNDNDFIWSEHVKTSIIKTVIESIYPFVIKMKKEIFPLDIKVVLACPENEYHEIGLRMVSDFFSLNGYDSVFIGTNTPRNQVCVAISKTKPKYVAISVTDFYLLFEAQKLIQRIKTVHGNEIRIIVGGRAFENNLDSISKIGGDIYYSTFLDIVKLREVDLK